MQESLARRRLLTGIGLRKVVVQREHLVSEAGLPLDPGPQQASVAAVIANPWVDGPPRADLAPATRTTAPVLARLLTERLVESLGGVEQIEAFGKAAIVGTRGEIEHAGALIHTPYFGNLVREWLDGSSIINFADGRAGAGETLTLPMWHKTQAATRSHYQTTTVRISDAPRPDEIVVVVAGATGARPHPRIGDRTTDPEITAAAWEAELV